MSHLPLQVAGCYRRCVSAPVKYPDASEWTAEDGVSDHLESVLQSECFRRTTTLRALLQYLWTNRDREMSEYAIAVEALGRNRDFESRVDSTVRVQIGRLRHLLARYYESEGRETRFRLVIPLGTHRMQWTEVKAEDGVVEAAAEQERVEAAERAAIGPVVVAPEAPVRGGGMLVPILVGVIVALLVCVGYLVWAAARPRGDAAAVAKRELPAFWKEFMDNGRAARIVLPTPLFFSWQPGVLKNTLMVRDLAVNDAAGFGDSAVLAEMGKRWGEPVPWQNYTVASDSIASLELARFLDRYGVHSSISRSNQAPGEIVDHENLVAFGTASFLPAAYRGDLDRLSFKMGPHEAYVIDRRLPADQAKQFPGVEESRSRVVTPGIIALVPRDQTGSRVLLMQGTQTTALISYLTSEDGMREITDAQAQHGNAKFFEAVVLSEVNEGHPIQSRLVAFRPFVDPGGAK
jgi:hypothetical protein